MVTITVLSVARSLPNRRHSLASHSIYLTMRKHEDIQETKGTGTRPQSSTRPTRHNKQAIAIRLLKTRNYELLCHPVEKRNTYYAKDSLPRNRPSARLFRVMRDVLKKDLIQPPRYATSLFEQVQSILTIKDQIKKPMKSNEEAS